MRICVMTERDRLNDLTEKDHRGAIAVHPELGPGMLEVGLLINFNVKWLVEDGIKRVVNGFPE